ncbi:DUF6708 domain-containing protein [Lysobacter sp. Root916]|uniref:DUF6708 domain-containing protein n=1 Tax=Lysobacter sp. Root916 TaxID=1736606 RepID=UPI0012F715DC|nr:DUF6708 domain-containing protein [Lysobacter sp. Root916]
MAAAPSGYYVSTNRTTMPLETEPQRAPRIQPAHPRWEQDLALRDAPPSGNADSWDELNHLDETYLEFSMATDIPRGPLFWCGIICLAMGLFPGYLMSITWPARGFDIWADGVLIAASLPMFCLALFFLRLDLRLPKDRPVRFNRRQGLVYANRYLWNHNPFGRWGGDAKVFAWSTLQAEITQQIDSGGEVATWRYAFELVACAPGSFEEVDRFRLQQGAQTTGQYEEQWELLRRYMNDGLEGLPAQQLRDRTPRFIDCLLFAMPWFAPTPTGRRARERMRGFFGTLMMVLMSLPFPLWLLFGVGNVIVMRLAPDATWPAGVDEASKRPG